MSELEICMHERNLLAQALGDLLIASKTIIAQSMTGPELLAHAEMMTEAFRNGHLTLRRIGDE